MLVALYPSRLHLQQWMDRRLPLRRVTAPVCLFTELASFQLCRRTSRTGWCLTVPSIVWSRQRSYCVNAIGVRDTERGVKRDVTWSRRSIPEKSRSQSAAFNELQSP